MFWGLIMEPNKRYTQTVEKPFHVSMATLDISTTDDKPVQVMLCYEGRNYLLCNLQKKQTCQAPLDLNFQEGTKISFTSNGSGHVHLTGYLVPDDDDMDDMDELEEEEEEEEEVPQLVGKQMKRKSSEKDDEKTLKKLKALMNFPENGKDDSSDSDDAVEEEEDENEDEEGEDGIDVEFGDDDDDDEDEDVDEEDEENDDEEEEEEDDDEEEEEEEVKPKGKQNKQQQKNQKQQKDAKDKTVVVNGKDTNQQKKNKKEQQQDKQAKVTQEKPEAKQQQQAPKKTVLAGGIIVEDIKTGNGAAATKGKFISVYYVGKLKNGKIFDETSSGKGFRFRLGGGEVIKGWDIGIVGMKAGGKRRLTIPAAMGYGKKGSPPVIPGNSVLVFDVELKQVH